MVLFRSLRRGVNTAHVLAAIALAIVGLGAQTPDTAARENGERLFASGKFSEARDTYTRALKQHSNNFALRAGLIETLMRLDSWQQALVQAQTAVRDAPQNADAHGLLALALLRAGQPIGAERETGRALELDANNYWGQVARGRLYLWNGQKAQAHDVLRQTALLRPQTPDAWFYLVDSFEDDVTEELLRDIDTYAALKPKGHPHDLAMESLPALRAYLNYFSSDAPYHADKPVSEADLKQADAGNAPPVTFSTPFEWSGNYVVMPVVLNAQPMRVLFDTGGGFSIALNKKAAAKLKLKPLGQSFVRGVSGREASTEAKADTMTVGSETFRAIPIDALTGDVGEEDGVFGVSNFDHYAVTVDFNAKLLTLARGKTAFAPAPKPENRAVTLPFHDLGGDIIIPVTIEGQNVWALVDTGADAEVILSLDLAREVAGKRKRESWLTQTVKDRLGLGNTIKKQNLLVFRDPVDVQLGEIGGKPFVSHIQPAFGADLIDTQVNPASMFQVSAIVGINFMNKAARVTFDYPHHLLTLEYAPPKH